VNPLCPPREEHSAQIILRSIGDAVLSTDAAGNVTYLNPVAERMTGWSMREALGQPATTVLSISDGDTQQPMPCPLAMAMRHDKPVGLGSNAVLTDRHGTQSHIEDTTAPIHDEQGRVIGAVIVFHDVSAARAMVRQLAHLAQHDALTDLPNRVLLRDRLSQSIEAVVRHGKLLAVMFLDLDGFKQVNDLLGHAAGDALLQSVGRELLGCVRTADTVSRHGGDEFVILLPEITCPRNVVAIAESMLRSIATPRQIAGQALTITASLGIAVFPHDGSSCETLLQNADQALLRAKAHGRGKYCFHARSVEWGSPRRVSVATGDPFPA
jgi:diguanylate cyclase (GGDEF)-like protein/PAS domain S-box-containing protein